VNLMKYFLLRHEYPNRFINGNVKFTPPFEKESITGGYYRVGFPLDLAHRTISVTMDSFYVRSLKVDFFLASSSFFASEMLATLLKLYQSDLQIIPADVFYSNGKPTEKTYYLVHTDQHLPCFDYHNSEYSGKALALRRLERGESPDSFMINVAQSIAIDEEIAAGYNFFFLKNVMIIDPIVSEPLVNAMREQKLKVHLGNVCTHPVTKQA